MSEVVFLFDDFISAGEQRRRNGEPERLGGLEVERHFEFRRLHYRQIGRLLAFQYPAAIDGRIAIGGGEVGAVTDEAAERDVVAPAVAGGNGMFGGERDDGGAPAVEVWLARPDDGAGGATRQPPQRGFGFPVS